jgi:hypothetical protein
VGRQFGGAEALLWQLYKAAELNITLKDVGLNVPIFERWIVSQVFLDRLCNLTIMLLLAGRPASRRALATDTRYAGHE